MNVCVSVLCVFVWSMLTMTKLMDDVTQDDGKLHRTTVATCATTYVLFVRYRLGERSGTCCLHTRAGQWAGHLVGFRLLGEMFSLVHAEAAGTTTKAVTLGAVLACVAHLAEQLSFVLRAVGGV